MSIKISSVMNSVQIVIDQELAQFGWVQSIATNSISNFKLPKSTVVNQTTDEKKTDLIDTIIFHLIFYMIFCYSLFLYVFIDLGFGSFIVKRGTRLIKFKKKNQIHPLFPSSYTLIKSSWPKSQLFGYSLLSQ